MTEHWIKKTEQGEQDDAYGWRITGAALGDEVDKAKIGTGFNLLSEPFIGDQHREFWRVLDDDGIEYFRGIIWGDHWSLEPLEDWAMPSYGATRIEIRLQAFGPWQVVN